jgi:plastocyanin
MRNPLAEFPTLPGGSYDGSYFINSGRIQAGDSFSVTFSKAGVFPYVCIPHINQGMVGTVEVVAPGGAGLTTQDDVDQEMAAADALFQAQFDDIVAKRSGPSSFERADGTREWFIRAGTDVRSEPDFRVGRLTVRMFLPNQLTIKQGDTVVWYTDTRVPVHNVLFPAAGTQVSSGYVPRMEDGSVVPLELLTPSGFYRGGDPSSLAWPRILADLDALVPSWPSPAYDPTKLFNSARLGDPSETQSRAWSLTFEKPGAFDYVCTVHVPVGMLGQIIVAPR